jgi:hypothetical protein
MSDPKEIFVLLADSDGTLRSTDEPFGVAVTNEEEAKRFVAEGGVGYTQSYVKITVFDNKDDALRHRYPSWYVTKGKS